MAKIRHIAIRSEDPEKTAKFFVEGFGLTLVQRRAHGPIDLSDGDVNITVLPASLGAGQEVRLGFDHIGFSVEDDEATRSKLTGLGAEELRPLQLGDVFYESKYKSPEGLTVDVGHWAGTSPLPSTEATPAGAAAQD